MSATTPAAPALYPSVTRLKAKIARDIRPYLQAATTIQFVYKTYLYTPYPADNTTHNLEPRIVNRNGFTLSLADAIFHNSAEHSTDKISIQDSPKLLKEKIKQIQSFMSEPEEHHKGVTTKVNLFRGGELLKTFSYRPLYCEPELSRPAPASSSAVSSAAPDHDAFEPDEALPERSQYPEHPFDRLSLYEKTQELRKAFDKGLMDEAAFADYIEHLQ